MNRTKMIKNLLLSMISIITFSAIAMEKESRITTRMQQPFYPNKGPKILQNAQNADQGNLTTLKTYVAREENKQAKIQSLDFNKENTTFDDKEIKQRYISKYARPLPPLKSTVKNIETHEGNLSNYYSSFDDFELAKESPKKVRNRLARPRPQQAKRKSADLIQPHYDINYNDEGPSFLDTPTKKSDTKLIFPGQLADRLRRAELEKNKIISERFDIVVEQETLEPYDVKPTQKALGLRNKPMYNNNNNL